jgi:hypothetical protein
MGKASPVTADSADKVVTATATTTGLVPIGLWGGVWNLTLTGGTGVIGQLERSFDGGTTYVPCTALGQPVTFNTNASEPLIETEDGVLYAFNVSAIASGTLTIRASQ